MHEHLSEKTEAGLIPSARWSLKAWIRVIQATALVGLVLSGYLVWVAWSHTGPIGCGDASADCDRVLQSRWSRVLGWPVAVPAVSVFASILAASLFAGTGIPERIRAAAWTLLCFLTLAAGGAAVWFIGVQAVAIGSYCPFCMATHACSLVLATSVLASHGATGRHALAAASVAFAAVGVLALVQVTDEPESHYAMTDIEQDVPFDVDRVDDAARRALINGLVRFDPGNHPILGDPAAPVVWIKLFDYTCYYCRRMHRQIDQFLDAHPGEVAVLMFPVPFDPKCNPWIEYEEPEHRDACDLARLAIAVWHLEPGQFAEFHRWLFEPEDPRGKHEAHAKAAELVGSERLAAELADRKLGERIELYCNLDEHLSVDLIPQILLSHSVLNGELLDSDFERLLQEELVTSLRAAGSEPRQEQP